MKYSALLVVVLCGFLGFASESRAVRGPQNVYETLHNFSQDGMNWAREMQSPYTTGTTRICIFCHTPHGGEMNAPLWNRDLTTLANQGAYNPYSSTTMSVTMTGTVNDASLVCLSCHDGSLGIGDSVINTAGEDTNLTMKIQGPMDGSPGAIIGKSWASPSATNDLSDDHPISISMYDAYQNSGGTLGDLNDPDGVIFSNSGMRLFGGAGAGGRTVECSTCHDPHVNYAVNAPGSDTDYFPFLATPNTRSAMCLACHKK
jgi:hypothetical protein